MSTPDLPPLVHSLSHLLLTRGWLLATAESCTGGGVAAACTDLAGSSAWFAGGVVSYSNAAKTRLLAVPTQVLEEHGAVSEAVVRLMAQGVLAPLQAQVGVAISGIAGPGGGTPTKPVGTVWLGWSWAHPNGVVLTEAECLHLPGDRADVRHAAVTHAVQGLLLRVPRWAGESGPI